MAIGRTGNNIVLENHRVAVKIRRGTPYVAMRMRGVPTVIFGDGMVKARRLRLGSMGLRWCLFVAGEFLGPLSGVVGGDLDGLMR